MRQFHVGPGDLVTKAGCLMFLTNRMSKRASKLWSVEPVCLLWCSVISVTGDERANLPQETATVNVGCDMTVSARTVSLQLHRDRYYIKVTVHESPLQRWMHIWVYWYTVKWVIRRSSLHECDVHQNWRPLNVTATGQRVTRWLYKSKNDGNLHCGIQTRLQPNQKPIGHFRPRR